jgi:hypothetical protein
LLAGVDWHDAALMVSWLAISQQPDVSEDAGVVEKLIWKHHNCIEPVVL